MFKGHERQRDAGVLPEQQRAEAEQQALNSQPAVAQNAAITSSEAPALAPREEPVRVLNQDPATEPRLDGATRTGKGDESTLGTRRPQQPRAMISDDGPEHVDAHANDAPTVSHELADQAANRPLEEKGYAEINHGEVEVKNLGWNTDNSNNVPNPLVGGLSNEELWVLVRRFDKQLFHVKAIPEAPLAELDLNIADEEEFSPDKLRSHIERLYMTVLVGLFSFWKHIVRLRSWREYRRTSAFLAVYIVAWLFNILLPTFLIFLGTLILYTPARSFCFPPAPPSLIDSSTGGVKTPSAGLLASDDSVTGAPQQYQGEAVEKEAHSFVTSISSLVVSTAAGKQPQGDPPQNSSMDANLEAAPDPADVAEDIVDAKDKTGGEKPGTHDKTKKPVTRNVWDKARPVMHGIADGFGFIIGFSFFGDPVIQRGIAFVERKVPDWQKYIELRNTLLKGIPTNAQLTITLLRIGERNKAPLPPPPRSDQAPPDQPHETAGEGLEHLGRSSSLRMNPSVLIFLQGVDQDEIDEAVQPDEELLAPAESETPEKKQKKGHRIVNFIKSTAKGGINTTLTANKVKAKVGSHHAKDRLGVVKKIDQPDPSKGPVRFPARYGGKRGHAYITATATTPALSWTSEKEDAHPKWSVTVGEIAEIQKLGGLGWKSKIVVGWATNREVADSLLIKDDIGNEYHLTAIETRDELFNRLVAMGSQMWETW
ncbi:uncharacterized protein VDAG_03791 [Verticillium dahliae VdLs.17]|uniref:Peroxin domain-containing protein n=1 Tax=Verticillium dahliae (strain VdLs.17 / ATCC MYA-4575 / FGSC 10137) TaxID=498257 RepID=G2X0L2_VERDV|nr:uncharacterized protein VDAG_03791 [Verticillium dahliae VdLs.17]EGY22353.1 hypothetical protein VDAG_03791 [Verticillium dahliae VdLs.17]KAF3343852.1 Vacuolar protein sorting-associated protein VTA1-like protein [Verticillium dahliae VDG2]